MVGYESINANSYALPIMCTVIITMIAMLYKVVRVIDSFDFAGHGKFIGDSDYNQPMIKIGKTMKCRRYKVTNGKLETYYTDENITGDSGYGGYYAGVNNPALISNAPAGTKYEYLSCLREWGYSESMPDPKCTVFGSPKMMEIVNREDVQNKAK